MTGEWKPEAPAPEPNQPPAPPPSGKRDGRSRRFVLIVLALVALPVLLIVGGIVWAAFSEGDRDDTGRIKDAGAISVFDLRVGDCVNDLEELKESMTVEAVPCSQPHDAETYATFDLPESDWPGLKLVTADAERGCGARDRLPEKLAEDEDAEIFFFHPTKESWSARDDRTVICLALFNPRRSGSLR